MYTTLMAPPVAPALLPRLMVGTHSPALQTSLTMRQLRPHRTTSGLQTIPTH
jgi:hypothetical protein